MGQQILRLSQCMIVKNEEKNIEKALSWGKDIVCEQIVVDTGSTDKTMEIAEKMGAKVVHFQWSDDFAAAKNFAIEQVTGDWIAFLDADEYFTEEDAAKLPKILREIHKEKVDFIRAKWIHLQTDGGIMGMSAQDRIFRNDGKLRYRYRIHEELYNPDKKQLRHYDAQDALSIMHTGYGGQTAGPQKGVRNARMLEQDVAANPENGARLMYLGDAYNGMEGKNEKAKECYRRVLWDDTLEIPDNVVFLRAGMQLMSMQQNEPRQTIEEEYHKIRETIISRCGNIHPDLDYFTGLMYLKAGDVQKASRLFEAAISKTETYRGGDTIRMAGNLEMVSWAISMAALNAGDLSKAVSFAVSALQINKYSPEGIQLLLKAFLLEQKPKADAAPYWQFLCRIYDTNDLKDMLFLRKFAQEMGFRFIAERANEMLPPEARER